MRIRAISAAARRNKDRHVKALRAVSILVLSVQLLASAELLAQGLDSPHDGFSIPLPTGWNETASDGQHGLRFAAEERLGVVLPGRVRIFQMEGQTNLAPAFVLVRVHEGRLPDFLIRSLLGTNNHR